MIGQPGEGTAAEPAEVKWHNIAGLIVGAVPLTALAQVRRNYRRMTDEEFASLKQSMESFGMLSAILVEPGEVEGTYAVLDGHHRWQAAREKGLKEVPAVLWTGGAVNSRLAMLTFNIHAQVIPDEYAALLREIESAVGHAELLQHAGLSEEELSAAMRGLTAPESATQEEEKVERTPGALAERFVFPPFSVLDARQGAWQERKRAWIALGIKSELGRGDGLSGNRNATAAVHDEWKDGRYRAPKAADAAALNNDAMAAAHGDAMRARYGFGGKSPRVEKALSRPERLTWVPGSRNPEEMDDTSHRIAAAQPHAGVSIFDPVLCELLYRWFSPPGGEVFDPFAGGTVRGVVAAHLGRHYYGVELRLEQVEANHEQWLKIREPAFTAPLVHQPDGYTTTEQRGNVWVKRDDLFTIAGVYGGKVRTCWHLAQGAKGLVTAGSRSSPQVSIVAHIAKELGIPCRVHVPAAADESPEIKEARECGAEIVAHSPGHNSVVIARARTDAKERGWVDIPFGMRSPEAIRLTAEQVPGHVAHLITTGQVKRVVIPVGSGASLCGVLHGLQAAGLSVPVLGVVVGASPHKTLEQFAPKERGNLTLKESGLPYDKPAPVTEYEGLSLDPIYEAKCIPFLEPGDLLWVVAARKSVAEKATGGVQAMRATALLHPPMWAQGDSVQWLQERAHLPPTADFLFSCPPYVDLERYSDDPRDISTMSYEDFNKAHGAIIAGAVARLKPDRFAAWVVGGVRGKDSTELPFVEDTIAHFRAAGCSLYNDAVLVTAVGSLPLRVGRSFVTGRKLGRTHQRVLVFVKGSWKKAVEACGDVEVGGLSPEELAQPGDYDD